MKKLFLALMMILTITSFSQVIPNKDLVVQAIGPTGADVTGLSTAVDFTTGAVYTCGYINTASSGKDLILVKLDSNLVQLWVATYDFTALDDKAFAVCVDGSGNVYVTGGSNQGSGNSDIVTIKYNSSGTQQWVSRVNGTNNTNDVGNSILFDGTDIWVTGYVTTASKGKDAIILKLNGSTGATMAQPKRNGTANGDDIGEKICSDGTSVFITGTTKNTTTNGDVFIACVNIASPALTWSTSINGSANGDDSGLDCKIDNGELYVCGYTNNTTTGNDYYFARINKTTGAVKYSDTYDGGYNGSDLASAFAPDKIGKYAVTGYITNGSNNEYHTRLYDTSSVLWTHVQPLNGAYTTSYPKIALDTIAQHFYVCGSYFNATHDGILYQLAPSGNKMWTQTHDGTNGAIDIFNDLVVDGLGRIFVCSPNETGSATNVYDYMVIRYSQTPVYLPCNYNLVTDTFSINHLYYPNIGQIMDEDYVVVNDLLYYTKFTSWDEYVQKNKISFCRYKYDTSSVSISDTIVKVDMNFSSANEFSEIFPFNFQENLKLNYFTTGDTTGITNVKGAAQLLVPNIYPMIDLHINSNGMGAKYFFVVKPTGDPNSIRLFFDGAASTTTVSGELKISTVLGDITFKKPDIYNVSINLMTMALSTTSITGTTGWVSLGSDTYSINPGSYNTALPLVLEFDMGKSAPSSPSAIGNMDWSTHLGGPSSDDVKDVKVDNSNNLYAVGKTFSYPFPNTAGSAIQPFHYGSGDGFIAKFNNTTDAGVPQWATYLGGDQEEILNSLDVGPNGNVFLVGGTSSANPYLPNKVKLGALNQGWLGPRDSVHFNPVQVYWHSDGLIAEITPNGDTLKWLTRFAGNVGSGGGNDMFTKCKFDGNGNLFLVGYTQSTNFPYYGPVNSYTRAYNNGSYTHNDFVTDGIILRLNASGFPTWYTTIGASTATNTSGNPPEDIMLDLTFDSNQDLYVGGYTQGNNFVTAGGGVGTGGQYDGVIARFDNTGVMKWSSHLGGSGYDQVFAIRTNTLVSDELYVTGIAQTGFPTTNSGNYYYDGSHNGGTDDVFLTIYDNTNARIHSTFLGGSGFDGGQDIEVDDSGLIHISGKTTSNNFYTPSPNNGYNATPNGVGEDDIFVCSLAKGMNDLLWTGVIGSDEQDANGYGYVAEIAIDNSQQMLYLGSMARRPDVSVQYPVLGSAPSYTQNCNCPSIGNMDGTLSRFDLTSIQALVSVSEIKKISNDIYVYPNPTNYELNVRILNFKGVYNYIVYNSIGQMVLIGNINNTFSSINVAGLTTGMYFIELTNTKERFTTKFIKHD